MGEFFLWQSRCAPLQPPRSLTHTKEFYESTASAICSSQIDANMIGKENYFIFHNHLGQHHVSRYPLSVLSKPVCTIVTRSRHNEYQESDVRTQTRYRLTFVYIYLSILVFTKRECQHPTNSTACHVYDSKTADSLAILLCS